MGIFVGNTDHRAADHSFLYRAVPAVRPAPGKSNVWKNRNLRRALFSLDPKLRANYRRKHLEQRRGILLPAGKPALGIPALDHFFPGCAGVGGKKINATAVPDKPRPGMDHHWRIYYLLLRDRFFQIPVAPLYLRGIATGRDHHGQIPGSVVL